MTTARSSIVLWLALASCAGPPPRPDVEPLFRTLETGTAAEAMDASEQLASTYDDSMRPRLEQALHASPARTLQLIGDLVSEGSALLLVDRLPYLLESKDAEIVRMAIVAAGLRRVKEASSALLERTEDPAALRALGRIWTRTLDAAPLPRKEEIDRLTVLALSHRLAMSRGSSVEACETMLAVMTRTELEDFLVKHSAEKFPARRNCDEAVRHRGFDPAKGVLIHEALLSSPDAELVGAILESSPFPLREELVGGYLQDERLVKPGVKVRDVAANRLKR